MIIEFNGLPGTGKTTVAGELKNILETQGLKCIFRYNDKQNRISRYFSYVFDGSLRLGILAKRFASCIKGANTDDKKKISSILVFYYHMYKRFMKECPNGVLLIDQGLLQGIISIAYTDTIEENSSLREIMEFLKNNLGGVCFVSCKNDAELAFERIRYRNTDAGRLDRQDDEELRKNLKIQMKNFDIVRSAFEKYTSFPHIELDTREPSADNASKLADAFFEVKR